MLDIPFYENTKDNLHCTQACLKSILKFHFSDKEYGFTYLDRMTGHEKDKWTWDMGMLLFLIKLGFKIIYIIDFDYNKFAKLGDKYLRALWTDEVYQIQKSYSDFRKEQERAKKLIKKIKHIKFINRSAMLSDLRSLIKAGNLIMTPINPNVLRRESGYLSHLVLVTKIKGDKITFHDPGLPPHKNRQEPIKLLFKAMCYPTKSSASLIAVKFPTK